MPDVARRVGFAALLVASALAAGCDAPPASRGSVAPADGRRSIFTDVTDEAGLGFTFTRGATGRWRIFEIMTSGGAFLDHDGDGDLDVFLVQGNDYDDPDPALTSRLFRNDGGRFTDVTEASGVGISGSCLGCAAADYDADGDVDMYVTCVGPDRLLRNRGDGTFADVTAEAGLGDDGFSSSAVWFDMERDGDLDLYVARYCRDHDEHRDCRNPLDHEQDYCGPLAYERATDLLYRNAGDGRFEEVGRQAGIADRDGYGFAVVASDFSGDGWLDLYVANDQSPALLWVNRQDGTFEERGMLLGAALSGAGEAIAGMGIVAEDFDADADFDLFVTNLRDKSHLFLRNDAGLFLDVSSRWGSPGWLWPWTGFGVVAFDQDHDGSLELFIANGAVQRPASPPDPRRPHAEPNTFVRRDPTGRFVDAAGEIDPSILRPALSRGVAVGDYDDDGDMDLLVCRSDDRPQLLRNEQRSGHHWLMVRALDAAGRGPVLNAAVTVEAGGRRQVREVRPHQSYLTTSDPRVHFGLGDAGRAERITVRWPDGTTEHWGPVEADRVVEVRRGEGRGG